MSVDCDNDLLGAVPLAAITELDMIDGFWLVLVLTGAVLLKPIDSMMDLLGADSPGADLPGTDLLGVDFHGTDMLGVSMLEEASLGVG